MRQTGSRSSFTLLVTLSLMILATVSAARLSAQASRGTAPAADINGFKVGDTVEVDTAFGWMDAQIVAAAGNNYRVHVNGVDVAKAYPLELHRKGAFTDRDHAVGLYDLKDRVQVNVQGRGWIEGAVTVRRGLEYQVQLPDNQSAWASGANIRYVGPPQAAAGAKAGTPPKPGFVSCAGKIEGRYASTGGFGNFTIVFRSGRATVTAGLGDDEVLECWTAGDKIILRTPGHPEQDMPIDINKDGTLQTPLGEIKKKGD